MKSLLKDNPNHSDFIASVMAFFQQQNFRYTLTPPPMPFDSVDSLLFRHQAGFCAHYASAFAFIMRIAGIPARIVTGYLGGEPLNQDTLSIYQYDAHAWVEIWDDNQGWLRYDPTLLVAPERVTGGLEQALAHENSFLHGRPFSLAKMKNIPWLNQLRLQLEQFDYWWTRWVIGFNQQQQLNLLESLLGELTKVKISKLTLLVMVLIGLLIAFFNRKRWLPQHQNDHQVYYQQALSLFDKHGFRRLSWQGPQAFCDQLENAIPHQAWLAFLPIHQVYMAHTYGSVDLSQSLSSQQKKHLGYQLKVLKKALNTRK